MTSSAGITETQTQRVALEGHVEPVDLSLGAGQAPGQWTLLRPSSGARMGDIALPEDTQLAVSIYDGKGGLCAVVKSPSGAIYIGLPGSSITLGALRVCLDGQPILPSAVAAGAIPAAMPVITSVQQTTPHAIILGAGLATRFERLSGETTGYAKPAVPLVGNTSVIAAIASHLAAHGFSHIFINTFFMRESLKAGLTGLPGVTFHYLDEPEPSGTAGGLRQVLQSPQRYRGYLDLTKPVLVVQGDAVTDVDFSALMAAHVANRAAVTIGCMVKPDEDVDKFGIVVTDGSAPDGLSGNIVRFMEKPSLAQAGSHRLASTGFYIFAPQAFAVVLAAYQATQQKTGQANPPLDFALDVFPEVLRRCSAGQLVDETGAPMRFWAQTVTGYWSDIGNPAQYVQTVREIAAGAVRLPLAQNCHLTLKDDIVYWPQTEALALSDGAVLSGNVVVAKAFSPQSPAL